MKNKTSNTRKARHFLYAVLVTCVFCGLETRAQDSLIVVIDIDTIRPSKPTKEQLPIVLQLLLEYEEDCYNDSTLTHVHNVRWNDSCYTQTGNLAWGYDYKLTCDDSTHYKWTHKEPTMADFYRWFSKKYGY